MKIYTKTGDRGETGTMGGKRLSKASLQIVATGEVDELNAVLGVGVALVEKEKSALAETENAATRKTRERATIHEYEFFFAILHQLQHDLFTLGTDLSTPLASTLKVPRITSDMIVQLEKWIDQIEAELSPLKNFILPGGSLVAANMHLARTVARRAERAIVAFAEEKPLNPHILEYINRLSDLLFVMARFANKLSKKEEKIWKV